MFPDFPALNDFLTFWETTLDGPLFAVTVAHSKLIKPAELHSGAAVTSSPRYARSVSTSRVGRKRNDRFSEDHLWKKGRCRP
jgi:hypothetical protein